jgi:hypothetical protein
MDQARRLFEEWQRQGAAGCWNRSVFVVEALSFHGADGWPGCIQHLTTQVHEYLRMLARRAPPGCRGSYSLVLGLS